MLFSFVMGVWGTGLFQNDTAADLRAVVRDLLAQGLEAKQVWKELKKLDMVGDSIDEVHLVLALASCLHKYGFLYDELKGRALEIIDSGADLDDWRRDSTAANVKAREKVLAKLKIQLESPQPPAKRPRKQPKAIAPYKFGSILEITLSDDRKVWASVTGYDTDLGGSYNYLYLLGPAVGAFDPANFTSLGDVAPMALSPDHVDRNFMVIIFKEPANVRVIAQVYIPDPNASKVTQIAKRLLGHNNNGRGWDTAGVCLTFKELDGWMRNFLDGKSRFQAEQAEPTFDL